MKLLGTIWARQAGVKIAVYEGDHDQRVLEVWAVVDQRSQVAVIATVEAHNRDGLARLLARHGELDAHDETAGG